MNNWNILFFNMNLSLFNNWHVRWPRAAGKKILKQDQEGEWMIIQWTGIASFSAIHQLHTTRNGWSANTGKDSNWLHHLDTYYLQLTNQYYSIAERQAGNSKQQYFFYMIQRRFVLGVNDLITQSPRREDRIERTTTWKGYVT